MPHLNNGTVPHAFTICADHIFDLSPLESFRNLLKTMNKGKQIEYEEKFAGLEFRKKRSPTKTTLLLAATNMQQLSGRSSGWKENGR